ncbi:fibrinogen-like protein 1 [Apostichopus japonicus]|uniref:fibrinogen-like protein 1 n=1 Tax=Stichopus japonicus TaxID=307972 RepID=UPI003AB82DD4
MTLVFLFVVVMPSVLADPTDNPASDAFGRIGCSVTTPRIENIYMSNVDIEYVTMKNLIDQIESKIDQAGLQETVEYDTDHPKDCSEITGESGVYTVKPIEGSKPFTVYCDMETDGGGWTVIQRRTDGSTGFNRGWVDYRKGFGSKNLDYWMGNENLFWMTAQDHYELRVELQDFQDAIRLAIYDRFKVGDEGTRYKLLIGSYNGGDAGDAFKSHNHAPFTTPDYDNDLSTNGNCAAYFQSGWWFTNCYHSNLNGLYRSHGEEVDTKGIVWSEWRGLNISLKATEMKIRPKATPLE